jgi:hypothetical protein
VLDQINPRAQAGRTGGQLRVQDAKRLRMDARNTLGSSRDDPPNVLALMRALDYLGQLLEGAVIRCIDAADVPERDPETFTHTGILMVRVHAGDAEEARALLAKAASAALEADPFIRRVEGTSVTRNPKRK